MGFLSFSEWFHFKLLIIWFFDGFYLSCPLVYKKPLFNLFVKNVHETWKVFTKHLCSSIKIFTQVKLKSRKTSRHLNPTFQSTNLKFLQVLWTFQKLLTSPTNFVKLFTASKNFKEVVWSPICKVVGKFCKLRIVVGKFYEFRKVVLKFYKLRERLSHF